MAEQPQSPPNIVQGFKGLNNRLDPTRLGLEWQLQATNALCDDAGYLTRRPGLSAFLSGFKDVHGTRDGRLLAITEGDGLVELTEDGDVVPWHTGVTGGPFQWAELGYALFLMSDSAQWAVYPDRVIPWGSLCPDREASGFPVGDPQSYPPPVGGILCARRSQLVIGVWEPDRDRSVLYFSRPDFPHEFRLTQDFLLLPGQVTLLASVAQGLVMATDRAIFTDPLDAPIQRVADYGVPEGAGAYDDRDFVVFWSARGLCRALPFENLTDTRLVVTLREAVTAGILPYQGSTYAVVSQYGVPVNQQRTRPYQPLPISTTALQGVS
jgi:hypothetical protein